MVVYCTVCMNNNRIKKDISYFNYPKESTRRHEWLNAVGREDLVLKIIDDNTRQRYRICEVHFEKSNIKFSKNQTKKYLHGNAFPTLNLPSNDGASLSQCETVPAQNQDIQIMPISTEQRSRSNIFLNKIVVLEDQTSRSIQTEPNKQSIESKAAQTALHLSADTPRKRKLSLELREAKKHKMCDLESVSKEQFLKLCDKFMTKSMSQIIKWQIDVKADYSGNRLTSWLNAIDREDINNKNKAAFRVCQMHFEPSSLLSTRKLDKNAVPSENLPNKNNITLAKLKQEPPEETEEFIEYPGTSRSTLYLETVVSNQPDTKENLLVAEKLAKLSKGPNEVISIPPEIPPQIKIPPRLARTFHCTTQTEVSLFKNTVQCQTPLRFLDDIIRTKIKEKKIREQAKKMKNQTHNPQSRRRRSFYELCDRYLNEKLANLVKMQSRFQSSSKGNRYHKEYKSFCLKLHQSNPQLYPALQAYLCLPNPKTLRRVNPMAKRTKATSTHVSAAEKTCEENDSNIKNVKTKPDETDFDMINLDMNQDNIASSSKCSVPPYPMLTSAERLKRARSPSTTTSTDSSESEPENNDSNEQSEIEDNGSTNQDFKTELFEDTTDYVVENIPEMKQIMSPRAGALQSVDTIEICMDIKPKIE